MMKAMVVCGPGFTRSAVCSTACFCREPSGGKALGDGDGLSHGARWPGHCGCHVLALRRAH
eukprot:7954097-Karenia_brevis.AAC.1